MAQGRKPVPIELKILRGNPGKRPIADDAPRADGVIPDCPRYLKGEARREWKRITQELANIRVISIADRVSIELYCDAYARWRYAREQIEDNDSMIITTEKGYQIQSPWVSIVNGAVVQMQKFLSEYGLTASSRAKVKIEKPEEDSLADKLRKAVNGN